MKFGQSMTPRQIGATNENLTITVAVSKDDAHPRAVLSYDDYQHLVELGLSPNWHLSGGNVCGYALKTNGYVKVPVARLLLRARAGEKIRYHDGNRLNLRRENLTLIDGYSVGDASSAP